MTNLNQRFLGRFHSWEPLGSGAEGRLYKVMDSWTGQPRAIKVGDGSPDSCSALIHEFQLLSRLRHPCVIQSLDLLWDGDQPGHLLEYVPAIDPASLWHEGGEEAATSCLVQAWRGLSGLHRLGWVHRDVSPGNVLVWREGDRWRAKLSDFGMSGEVSSVAAGLSGTVGYIGPEVVRGEPPTSASDLFGLAATCIYWIDGDQYFGDLDMPQVLKRMSGLQEPLSPKRSVGRDIKQVLASLSHPHTPTRVETQVPGILSDVYGGPPILEPSIHGLDSTMERWLEWVESGSSHQPGLLAVEGLFGTGRHTAINMFSRILRCRGWSAVGGVAVDYVQDWLQGARGRPDPVDLSRELSRRFAGSDVVVEWPRQCDELESRLLRAFVAGRDEAQDKTLVLKATGSDYDEHDGWLRANLRVCEERTDRFSLLPLAQDLWPGVTEAQLGEKEGTPLSLVAEKRAQNAGVDLKEVSDFDGELEAEAALFWSKASEPSQMALALLSCSEHPWPLGELSQVLRGDEWVDELDSMPFVKSMFDRESRSLSFSDPLLKRAMAAVAKKGFSPGHCKALSLALEAVVDTITPDIGLASSLWSIGQKPRSYGKGAIEVSLNRGAYPQVLSFYDLAGDEDAYLEMFWEAAKNFGQLPLERDLLQKLVAKSDGSRRIELQRRLIQVLCALGAWDEGLKECRLLKDFGDREWAQVQEAEITWQKGDLEGAEKLYDAIEVDISPDHGALGVKFVVGRARMSHKRMEYLKGREWLDRITSFDRTKKHLDDPMFLMTTANSRIALGDRDAVGTREATVRASESVADWQTFVMAKTNNSIDMANAGQLHVAVSGFREAMSVAEALGSPEMADKVKSMSRFTEVRIGRPSAAIRSLFDGRADATEGVDLQARLFAFASYGMLGKTSFEEACLPAVTLQHLRGTNAAMQLDWREALDLESEVVPHVSDYSKGSSTNFMATLVNIVEAKLNLGMPVLDELNKLKDIHPNERLLTILETLAAADGIREEVYSRMADERALMELCRWSYYANMNRADELSVGTRKKIIEAFKLVSQDFSELGLGKLFLSTPRIRATLEGLAKGSES